MNIVRFQFLSLIASLILLGFAFSCGENDPPLPPNTVTVSASELGLAEEDTQATITINVSRPANADKNMTISFVPDNVTYGVEFTTVPAAVDSKITVVIPSGTTSASFVVKKAAGVFLEGSIKFTVDSVEEPFVLSDKVSVNLSFSPIVSVGSEMQLNGLVGAEAGSSAGNSVYVDFSANEQTSVERVSWDLGFYSGAEFRVILNNTKGSSAVQVNKTSLSSVTAADVNADDLKIGGGTVSFDAYDSISGDLKYTAIKEISSNDADNKVYVINRIGGSNNTQPVEQFIKIRVTRNGGSGYKIEYAPINETTNFKTLTIAKDELFNFSFLNFDTGITTVEPAKNRWDIQWTWSIYWTNLGGSISSYAFSDLVFLNHHNGVKAASVSVTAERTYDNFTEANLTGITFSSDRNVIGADWRNTTGTVGVKTDRFYLIQDPQGNIYKLKFVNFHAADGGTRGKPNIKYALVKKSS